VKNLFAAPRRAAQNLVAGKIAYKTKTPEKIILGLLLTILLQPQHTTRVKLFRRVARIAAVYAGPSAFCRRIIRANDFSRARSRVSEDLASLVIIAATLSQMNSGRPVLDTPQNFLFIRAHARNHIASFRAFSVHCDQVLGWGCRTICR